MVEALEDIGSDGTDEREMVMLYLKQTVTALVYGIESLNKKRGEKKCWILSLLLSKVYLEIIFERQERMIVNGEINNNLRHTSETILDL